MLWRVAQTNQILIDRNNCNLKIISFLPEASQKLDLKHTRKLWHILCWHHIKKLEQIRRDLLICSHDGKEWQPQKWIRGPVIICKAIYATSSRWRALINRHSTASCEWKILMVKGLPWFRVEISGDWDSPQILRLYFFDLAPNVLYSSYYLCQVVTLLAVWVLPPVYTKLLICTQVCKLIDLTAALLSWAVR